MDEEIAVVAQHTKIDLNASRRLYCNQNVAMNSFMRNKHSPTKSLLVSHYGYMNYYK